MDADQGFRKAPGSLLRIAAGAGAAALIVTAVSAARRAGTAMADRGSGPAQGSQVPPSAVPVPSLPTDAAGPGAPSGPLTTATAQTTPDVRPSPATPEPARSCDLAARSRSARHCSSSVSPRCRPWLAVAGPAAGAARRMRGHRGAGLRTGMMLSRRSYLRSSAIPRSPAPRGAAARIRPGTTPGSPGARTSGASTPMTTPAGPDARARTLCTPITRAGGEGPVTRGGTPRNRSCGRTATPAGPSLRTRPGATPNGPRRMTVPAGAAAEYPRGQNRGPRRIAARTAGQLRASRPRARGRSCPRRWRAWTFLPGPAMRPGRAPLLT